MRIVAVADTHGFEARLGSIPDGDIFIHAGDLCRAGRLDELRGPAAFIAALPHRHKIVVPGNHDWCFVRELDAARALIEPGATLLLDAALTIDGVRVWGSPWTPRFFKWAFMLSRGDELARKWAEIPTETDVLITHGPPRGFGDRVLRFKRQGCDVLRVAVGRVQPWVHLFGHIHEDGGAWREGETLIANVTTWECRRPPTVLDIDPDTGHVEPVDVPPRAP